MKAWPNPGLPSFCIKHHQALVKVQGLRSSEWFGGSGKRSIAAFPNAPTRLAGTGNGFFSSAPCHGGASGQASGKLNKARPLKYFGYLWYSAYSRLLKIGVWPAWHIYSPSQLPSLGGTFLIRGLEAFEDGKPGKPRKPVAQALGQESSAQALQIVALQRATATAFKIFKNVFYLWILN